MMNKVILPIIFFILIFISFSSHTTEEDSETSLDWLFELTLEELLNLTVTATKRESNVQTTPVSMLVLSGLEIDYRSMQHITELGTVSGSFHTRATSYVGSRFSARGVSGGGGGVQGSSSIGYYVDEIALTAPSGEQDELLIADVNRIEILHGPQGTLFGDGSLSGTVRIITNKPVMDKSSVNLSLGVESIHDGGLGHRIVGIINSPIIEDTVAARLVFLQAERPGWQDNILLHKQVVNSASDKQVRLTLRVNAADKWLIDLSFISQDINNLNDHFSDKERTDRFTLTDELVELDNNIFSFTSNYELPWADLLAVGSVSNREKIRVIDATPFSNEFIAPVFESVPLKNVQSQKFESLEFRLTSKNDDVFEWTSGIFFKHIKRSLSQQTLESPNLAVALDNSAFSNLSIFYALLDYDIQQLSLFGEMTYHFDESVALTLGSQFFVEERNGEVSSLSLIAPAASNVKESNNTSASTPRAIISWERTPEQYYFASISEGFRSGGVNIQAAPIDEIFPGFVPKGYDAETVVAYELGAKFTHEHYT